MGLLSIFFRRRVTFQEDKSIDSSGNNAANRLLFGQGGGTKVGESSPNKKKHILLRNKLKRLA